ncbi:MAG: hypothetical protein KME27_10545 [Lyngbya sp. HA4199-MV5]|jgi:hypothetical protein|nr:hypothetical protein [Lyngbya sp. HA4199-MV5]
MAVTLFNVALGNMLETYFNAASPPSATGFYLILTNGGTIDATTSLSAVLAQEVSGNGYARANYNPGTGAYDNGQSRYELPPITVTFSASGGAIVFDKAVLIANTAATGTAGNLFCFQAQTSATTIPDGTSYSFQAAINAGGNNADVNAA